MLVTIAADTARQVRYLLALVLLLSLPGCRPEGPAGKQSMTGETTLAVANQAVQLEGQDVVSSEELGPADQTKPERSPPRTPQVTQKDHGSSTRTGAAARNEAGSDLQLPSAPVMAGSRHGRAVAERLTKRDPRQDVWVSEVSHEQIAQQFKKLATLIAQRDEGDIEHLAKIVVDKIESSPLRGELREVFSGPVEVLRGTAVPASVLSGREAFAVAIRELAAGLEGGPIHAKFKVIQIEILEDAIETVALYQANAIGSRARGQTATWECRWTTGSDTKPPQLSDVLVRDFEEVVGPSDGGPILVDSTAMVLGNDDAFRQQLIAGKPYWAARIPSSLGTDLFGHQGLAVGDVNGDDLDDLFVCQPGGLPNRLFLQQPDGTAVDVSTRAGLDVLDRTGSALILDLDNDGDQDLAFLTPSGLNLFANSGTATFTKLATLASESKHSFSISAADFDLDGDLDIYICGYSYPTGKARVPTPYHDANNGFRNLLLRNDGNWQFSDVTADVGLEQNNRRYSFASAWEDFDNDGDPDLYVANDYGRNNLYRNDGGEFVDVAAAAGVEDISAGMAITWGDYNRDGWLDLYVSNMFSSAGNRVTFQRNFGEGLAQGVKEFYQRHARGNSLFENLGDGTFRDVSVESGTTMGRWAWGSQFVDLNNDGREDLVVANGNLTGPDADDL